jgi:hypothetical protein
LGAQRDLQAAALLADDVVIAHADLAEVDGADGVGREHAQRLHREAFGVGRNEEARDSASAGAGLGLGEDAVEVRQSGVADEGLCARDFEPAGDTAGTCCHGGQVAAGLRLGDGEGGDGGSLSDFGQPLRALRGRAGERQRHGPEALEGEEGVGEAAAVGDALPRRHEGADLDLGGCAAEPFGDGVAEEAGLGHPPEAGACGRGQVVLRFDVKRFQVTQGECAGLLLDLDVPRFEVGRRFVAIGARFVLGVLQRRRPREPKAGFRLALKAS